MKDYSCYSIDEVINLEAMQEFTDNIRLLDSKIVAARLVAIINMLGKNESFIDIALRFNKLAPHKTSVDPHETK